MFKEDRQLERFSIIRRMKRSDDAGGVNPGADNLAGESTEENTSCDRNNNSHGDGCNCRQNADCASDVCQNGKCKHSTCTDTHKNHHKTDVDCGDDVCLKCGTGKRCKLNSDCQSGVCKNKICQAPVCNDGVKNQDETDFDSGGSDCPKCLDNKGCNSASDCTSGVCTLNICQVPTCSDGVQNQDESDFDCGGLHCPKCLDLKGCNTASDCVSGVCSGNICQVPTCNDGANNQDETGIDCGGSHCPQCGLGQGCNVDSDCKSHECKSNVCQQCSLSAFINGDFEQGTSFGWTIGGGSRNGQDASNVQPKDYFSGGSLYLSNIANTHSSIVTQRNDPNLGSLMPNIVFRGNYSWRVEDTTSGGYVSTLSQKINSYYCSDIYFAWLAVLQNGYHTAEQSSLIIIELKDVTVGDILISRRYNGGAGAVGIDSRFSISGSFFYTRVWQIEHLIVDTSRLGHNFVLTVSASDCASTAHTGYVYIDSFGGVSP